MAEDNGTRERLLKGARTVFAELGLKNATIRDICTRAEANVAAVSYHFGGKERLYLAVLQDYIERENRRHPRDQGVTPESPPQDRLRAYVCSILLQNLGGADAADKRLGRLLTQEFVEPSQHFGDIYESFYRPTHRVLLDIIEEMLPGADDLMVSRCASSIIGQCVLFDFAGEALSRMSPELALKPSNIEQIADFIMQFSLGGLARMCSGLEACAGGRATGQEPKSIMRSEGDR